MTEPTPLNPLAVALSVTSDFSLGESTLQVGTIAKKCAAFGYSHVAMTDVMTISGYPNFAAKCKDSGITPIAGVTLHIVDQPQEKIKDKDNNAYRLRVFPKSEKGMQSIYRVLSQSLKPDNFYYNQRLGLEDVLMMEDVIVTSGNSRPLWMHPQASEINSRLKAQFKDDYYVELVALATPLYDRINELAIKGAGAEGVKLIVSRPAYYELPEHADSLVVLKGITTNTTTDSQWLQRNWIKDMCLIDAATFVGHCKQLQARVAFDLRAAVTNVGELVSKAAGYVLKKQAPSLPVMAENEFLEVVNQCKLGWAARFSTQTWGQIPAEDQKPVYAERLRYELSVLRDMGFSNYFLLVQDIVRWAKNNGCPVGPGRGSVGGSLVAYLMGITDVDPVRFGLLFERFINPERIDLPDADLDFMSSTRHKAVEYVVSKYGKDRVAGIVNFSTLGAASALRDTARISSMSPFDYACSKLMEKENGIQSSLTESADKVAAIDAFRQKHPGVWNHALALEGCNRSLSQHAAGVVVAGEEITNRAVVSTRGGDESLPVIQWDKKRVEDFGLIKIDMLGLNNLDMIEMARTYVAERTGVDVAMTSLPLDDPKVLENFRTGDTIGVFQFSGGGMRKLLKDMGECGKLSFEDVAAATALFRPGPLESGLCEQYVNIKNGRQGEYYIHPAVEASLKETFGVIVYQEQVMAVSRQLCGFTRGGADHLRKAIGKKDLDKMATYADQFIQGAVAGYCQVTLEDGSVVSVHRARKLKCSDGIDRTVEEALAVNADVVESLAE